MTPPRKFSALPPQISTKASPKAISRRTSYLRVRLEFLPYPHLIPTLFNGCGFGYPLPLTAASTHMDRSPGFGSAHTDSGIIRLGFLKSGLESLNLPVCNSPNCSTKVRGRAYKNSHSLNTGFQVLFHSLLSPFSPFLHSTMLSVTKWYLALGVSPLTSTGFLVSCMAPGSCSVCSVFRVQGFFTLSGRLSQTVLLTSQNLKCKSVTPDRTRPGFRLFRVRSPLLTESSFLSFPPVLRCFSSQGSSIRYGLAYGYEVCSCGFPHSEISGSMDICSSPKLIAAYHVFSSCQVPHPPCALSA